MRTGNRIIDMPKYHGTESYNCYKGFCKKGCELKNCECECHK